MTGEMLELARANQRHAGVTNAEFVEGSIEDVPLPDGSVDVVLSNCVINLSADKPAVLAEAFRVLRPGGRLAVADVVADQEPDPALRDDLTAWAECIAGAVTRSHYRSVLADTGFVDIEIIDDHGVADGLSSVFVKARTPVRREAPAAGPVSRRAEEVAAEAGAARHPAPRAGAGPAGRCGRSCRRPQVGAGRAAPRTAATARCGPCRAG